MQYEEYFSLNHVVLAGAILSLEPADISAEGVHLVTYIRTHEESYPHAVVFKDRNALECLTLFQVQNDVYPEEAFFAHIVGSIKTNEQRSTISGYSVVFLVPFDVRELGEQILNATFKRYAELYGDRPWLHADTTTRMTPAASPSFT